jgi:hypothetical protein
MASEQRTLVQLKDIKAIEFECDKCHTRSSYAIDKFAHPMISCNVCQKEFIEQRSKTFTDWVTFAKLLNTVSQTPPGLTVRFEVPATQPPR